MKIKDIMYFKTYDNEFIKLERFNGETFKIYSSNYPVSFSQCKSSEISNQVNKGVWIEVNESEYNKHWVEM